MLPGHRFRQRCIHSRPTYVNPTRVVWTIELPGSMSKHLLLFFRYKDLCLNIYVGIIAVILLDVIGKWTFPIQFQHLR